MISWPLSLFAVFWAVLVDAMAYFAFLLKSLSTFTSTKSRLERTSILRWLSVVQGTICINTDKVHSV